MRAAATIAGLVLAAAAAEGQTSGFDPQLCVGPSRPRNVVFGHADLGHGRVLEERAFADRDLFQIEIAVTDCATGDTAHALVRTEGPLGRNLDVRIKALAVARAAAAEPADTIRERLLALGAPGETFTIPDETCACAAFYPDLRGDRPAWTGD